MTAVLTWDRDDRNRPEQANLHVFWEEDTVNELKSFLNDAQLVVLAAAVGQANFTNRFNEAFAVELP